ncbi:hypothetical protein HOLleu_20860 [Holothuria leucospilota]|uniref:Peptidase aspartic putative domain-containing protein n=1 Tax=Holothuria leucospilota TaxID=206669 RepID=A0A9Q1H6E9_HOLLE|nr:hypothetical protein HOLleu_20860 [Holothuria leucospilota]
MKFTSNRSSNCSTSSQNLKEARVKHELAKLKVKQVNEKLELEQKQRQFAEDLLLLDAKNELECSELETSFWANEVEMEGEMLDDVHVSNVGPKVKVEDESPSHADRGKEVHSGKVENKIEVNAKKPPQVNTYPLNPNAREWQGAYIPDPRENGGADPFQLCNMLNLLTSIPKPELQTFDGEPTEYWSFINNFDFNIGSKLFDDRAKLTYLVQYCRGAARKSIEGCVVMGSTEGYKKAREILSDQFGQPHIIAQSLLSKVLERKPVKAHDGVALWEIARDMRKCEVVVEQMNYSANLNNTDTLLGIQLLLPIHLQSEWAKQAQRLIQSGVEPRFVHLTEFVERSARAANNVFGKNISKWNKPSTETYRPKGKSGNNLPRRATFATVGKEESAVRCYCCSQGHLLHVCKEFKAKTPKQRKELIRKQRLCDNCFKTNHMARGCMSENRCTVNGCKKKHHPLLHAENVSSQGSKRDGTVQNVPGKEEGDVAENTANYNATSSVRKEHQVKLCTVPVKVKGKSGKSVTNWALLNNASDVTLCNKQLIKELDLGGKQTSFELSTVNDKGIQQQGFEVSMTIESLSGDEFVDLPKVWSVDRLPISSKSIPSNNDIRGWPHLEGIELPSIGDQQVMLLIGGNVPEVFWVLDEKRGGRKDPYAIKGLLGWTLIGPTGVSRSPSKFTVNHISHVEQVENCWQSDFTDLGADSKVGESLEDKRAHKMLENSIKLVNGRYEVGLPWRYPMPYLPNNRVVAEKRLSQLKKRFQRDDNLLQLYSDVIHDYISKGYGRKVTEETDNTVDQTCKVTSDSGNSSEQLNQSPPQHSQGTQSEAEGADEAYVETIKWYLPHQPVLHSRKPGRVRVGFDCASRYKGICLNDQLLHGPDYTNNLIGVLSRFWRDSVALIADVEAMFHQVRVPENHSNVLRFLWWPGDDFSRPPVDYQMMVHLFGATSSPSCASFALKQTAKDNRESFSEEAVRTVNESFYVDDCLKSVQTKEQAVALVKELRELLHRGGFRLTKWVSNSRDVLETARG